MCGSFESMPYQKNLPNYKSWIWYKMTCFLNVYLMLKSISCSTYKWNPNQSCFNWKSIKYPSRAYCTKSLSCLFQYNRRRERKDDEIVIISLEISGARNDKNDFWEIISSHCSLLACIALPMSVWSYWMARRAVMIHR